MGTGRGVGFGVDVGVGAVTAVTVASVTVASIVAGISRIGVGWEQARTNTSRSEAVANTDRMNAPFCM